MKTQGASILVHNNKSTLQWKKYSFWLSLDRSVGVTYYIILTGVTLDPNILTHVLAKLFLLFNFFQKNLV